MQSFECWRHLANCALLWRTSDDLAAREALLDKIAETCCELERKGEPASIWHALALVAQTPCQCARCNPRLFERRVYADLDALCAEIRGEAALA